MLRDGIPATTSMVTVEDFLKSFDSVLQQGRDLLYIAFSSGLSGTYSSAELAAKELREKYPERKIMIVDSLAASMGEGLLVYNAVQQKKNGASIEQVYQWVLDNRDHLCHWFTVDDLKHLKRGGRISATTALVGSMLHIKPILHVDNAGHLIPVSKVRGRKRSLIGLVDRMEETCVHPEDQVIFISHGDALEDAQTVANLVQKRMHVRDIKINTIGPIIGAHSGPGTIALFFLGTKK